MGLFSSLAASLFIVSAYSCRAQCPSVEGIIDGVAARYDWPANGPVSFPCVEENGGGTLNVSMCHSVVGTEAAPYYWGIYEQGTFRISGDQFVLEYIDGDRGGCPEVRGVPARRRAAVHISCGAVFLCTYSQVHCIATVNAVLDNCPTLAHSGSMYQGLFVSALPLGGTAPKQVISSGEVLPNWSEQPHESFGIHVNTLTFTLLNSASTGSSVLISPPTFASSHGVADVTVGAELKAGATLGPGARVTVSVQFKCKFSGTERVMGTFNVKGHEGWHYGSPSFFFLKHCETGNGPAPEEVGSRRGQHPGLTVFLFIFLTVVGTCVGGTLVNMKNGSKGTDAILGIGLMRRALHRASNIEAKIPNLPSLPTLDTPNTRAGFAGRGGRSYSRMGEDDEGQEVAYDSNLAGDAEMASPNGSGKKKKKGLLKPAAVKESVDEGYQEI